MLHYIWVKYDNVVLHHLPIFHISFIQRLTLRRIQRTSDQMHQVSHLVYTMSINLMLNH